MRQPIVALVAVAVLVASCGTAPEGESPDRSASSASSPITPPSTASAAPAGNSTDCPGGDFVPVTHREAVEVSAVAEPEPGVWWHDPAFGACVLRLSDRQAHLDPDDPSPGLRHEYARVQAFNADETRILLQGTEGFYYLYDAAALQPIAELSLGVEPRWDDQDPDLLYYLDETRLFGLRVATGATELLHDFAGDLEGHDPIIVWTRWEGSPSIDRRHWGFMAENQDWLPTALVVYDLEDDLVAVMDLRGVPEESRDIDHVTMSSLGTYLLASFDRACEPGIAGNETDPCGLMVFDRSLTSGRSVLRIAGHYDTALDADGREVAVFQDIDTDEISMVDLANRTITALIPIDFSHTGIGLHVSGLGIDRPGWAVVSTHDDDPATYTWLDDQVMAVELAAGGRVVRLAQTHSVVDDDFDADYWAEPHATTNPSLTLILFATNWGRTGSGAVDAYLIALPPDWSDRLD